MRILQIGMPIKIGGIQNFIMNFYRNMDRTKIQFDFVFINTGDDKRQWVYADEIKNMGGCIYYVTDYRKSIISYINELKNIIINNNYQVVHVNMNSAVNIFPMIAAKIGKTKKIIAHAHASSNDGGNPLKTILHEINKRFIPFFATDYFACSNMAGQWFFNKKIYKNKLKIINNAIDAEKFVYNKKLREEIRKELNIENKFVIGNIGRFFSVKNHIFLIDIFFEIKKIRKNSLLLLVGDGETENDIKNKISKLGLEKDVIILGRRKQIYKIYQAMDVFVLPSLHEGLGMVAIEAEAASLPTIVSNGVPPESNITELLKVVNLSDSPKQWAEEIISSSNNFVRKNNLNEIIKANYDIKSEAEKLYKFYIQNK